MELHLTEWQRAGAGPGDEYPVLQQLFLDDPRIQSTLEQHPLKDRLRVSEGRYGLVIQAKQHVGVLQLGPLRIRIQPKMPTKALWKAVSYALGLDQLIRHAPVEIEMAGDFADLLALMLLQESERLWRFGIHRGYREESQWLATPRGRPDLITLARNGPLTEAKLPCRYYAFTADIVENQVVLAGLALARRLASQLKLRTSLHRAHQQWSTICTAVPLGGNLLDQADRKQNRLTQRYAPVHRLVRLLHERSGLDDEHQSGRDNLPGFLWNMAILFESFVARFLTEHLSDHEVLTQEKLRHMYEVVQGGPALSAPRPRPDIVLRRRSDRKVLGVFDTKYKDLWDQALPREILYQMSVYALAWSQSQGKEVPAVVLYPTVGQPHPDMELRLRVSNGQSRQILLRAVDWGKAALCVGNRESESECVELARGWVL